MPFTVGPLWFVTVPPRVQVGYVLAGQALRGMLFLTIQIVCSLSHTIRVAFLGSMLCLFTASARTTASNIVNFYALLRHY